MMNKLIAVVFFAFLSLANAKDNGGIKGLKNHGHFTADSENYIMLNSLQYKHILDGFDTELQRFKESYNERLESVTINRELLLKSIIKSNARFDPLEVLSDFSRKCVVKYRFNIPTVEVTKTAVTSCRTDFSNQLTTLLNAAVNTRKSLAVYIETYNQDVKKCGKNVKTATSYTHCVTNLTDLTNNLVIGAEKNFQIQIEAAECIAKANIKSAIDCSYHAEYRTHTLISEAELKIDLCLSGQDDCKPCEEYTCSESYDLYSNVNNKTIVNPFFGRSKIPQCLMLNVK